MRKILEKKSLPLAQREIKASGIKKLFIKDSISGQLVTLNRELLSDFRMDGCRVQDNVQVVNR